jgi:hypothetical protein
MPHESKRSQRPDRGMWREVVRDDQNPRPPGRLLASLTAHTDPRNDASPFFSRHSSRALFSDNLVTLSGARPTTSMLITVSGIVGSGKSTAVKRITTILESAGVPARDLRFQSLPCFAWLTPGSRKRRSRTDRSPSANAPQEPKRWKGYRRRPLTARSAAVYIVRIVMFRLYRLTWRSEQWHITNRYFYDSLTHYHLTGQAERLWYGLIRRLIPVPDIAILVTASAETVSARRPGYAPEYLLEVARGYDRLRADFPALVEVRTDAGDSISDPLEAVLRRWLESSLG